MASNLYANTKITLINTSTQSGIITLPQTSDIPFRCVMFKDYTGYTNNNSTATLSTSGLDRFENGSNSIVLSNSGFSITLYANTYTNRWITINNLSLTGPSQGINMSLVPVLNPWYDNIFSQVLTTPLNPPYFHNPDNYSYFKVTFTLSGSVALADPAYGFFITFSNITQHFESYGIHFEGHKYNYTYSNLFDPYQLEFSYTDFFPFSGFSNGDQYTPQLYMMGYFSGGDGNYFTDGSLDFAVEPVKNYTV